MIKTVHVKLKRGREGLERAHVAVWKEELAASVHATFGKLPFTTAAVGVRQHSAAVRQFVLELALVA